MGMQDLKFDLFRLENLRDQEMKYKMWMRESPDDKSLKEELDALIIRKDMLTQKIDTQLLIIKDKIGDTQHES